MHPYQLKAINFANNTPKCGLFLDMGLGKTVISLTLASDALASGDVDKVLIIAPLKVARTVWGDELKSWEHLQGLTISHVLGDEKARLTALKKNVDIYIINRELVDWLVSLGTWSWDMVIVDEITSFKNSSSKRFKALKKVNPCIKKLIGLSGTPAPNGLIDIWAIIYLLDCGERLGRNITAFKRLYYDNSFYSPYVFTIKKGASKIIQDKIKDICLSMSASDYLDIKDKHNINKYVYLSDAEQLKYNTMKKEYILNINNSDIFASTAGVLGNKLLQLANGNIYDDKGLTHKIHNKKIKALQEIKKQYPNNNLLVAYNFKSDLVDILNNFNDAILLSADAKELPAWNNGDIKMLLASPISASYGLNAQYGGRIVVWYGLPWSLELYQQFNARLHRQGQDQETKIIHIITDNTIDNKIMNVLQKKDATQQQLINAIKAIV